jgi:hypothetical protein
MGQGQYSQHYIYFITFEWDQQAEVFVPVKPFMSCVMECSSLLGPFPSNEELGFLADTKLAS